MKTVVEALVLDTIRFNFKIIRKAFLSTLYTLISSSNKTSAVKKLFLYPNYSCLQCTLPPLIHTGNGISDREIHILLSILFGSNCNFFDKE